MDPADLELPPKFVSWRPNQEDAVISAACSDRRFTILSMPPGLGKSPTYMAVHRIVGGRTLVLTQTRGLQRQLEEDFASMGLRDIKGQNNYPCLYLEVSTSKKSPTCDDGPCHAGVECELKGGGCFYYDAVRRAAKSNLVVSNYQYWMTIQRFADPTTIGAFDTLVLDEAHDAADILADFVRIHLDRKQIKRLLKVDVPRRASLEEWVEWADETLPIAAAHLESAKNAASMTHHWMTSVRDLLNINRSLHDLKHAGGWRRTDAPAPPAWVPGTATDWIVEESDKDVTFQPIWASSYAEDYLFRNIPRIIMVSATVTQKDATYLGIDDRDILFKSYPSPFDKANRPIFYFPTTGVGRNMTSGQERVWMNRIDFLIEQEAVNKGHKGIVHTVSYARADYIKRHSKWRDIILTHDTRSARETIANFRWEEAPCVLVSPSVSTGWDFPDDLCRFQIIAKLPFIDNRPAVIQARHKSDKHYLDYVTAVTLMQMVGRGVRSERDWARTYIIDDNWRWFYSRNKALFPRWFKSAVRVISAGEF